VDGLLQPLSSQWQLSFFILALVMGALVWRAHKQVTRLGATASRMSEELALLSRTVAAIEGRTSNTEHTLIANLSEYRMAVGSTSAYRDYLQKLGVAPASDVEPILEAIPDGAMAVGKDGSVLYVNRALFETTGLAAGMTLDDVVARCNVRDFDGEPLDEESLPERRVLAGEDIRESLVRMRAPDGSQDLILLVNGSPVRDVRNSVVAAVMIARPVAEEVALAIEVRQISERRRGGDRSARNGSSGDSVTVTRTESGAVIT
jgi:PAS domain S-box-containing protein